MTQSTAATLQAPVITAAPAGAPTDLPLHKRCGPVEFLLFAAGFFLFFYLLVTTADAEIMFSRHFWLDEYLTSLIVLDPSITHALAAVKDGVDTNPPVYHMLLRAFYKIVGGHPESTFRLFSGICVCGALVIVYALLRRSFKVLPSLVTILALTSNPLVIKQACEARFYGALLLAAVSFTFFYCDDSDVPRPRLRLVMLAISSILTCTIHYFGIFAVAGVVAGDLLVRKLDRKRMLATACGVVAVIASLPIAASQKRGLLVPTWIEPVNFTSFSQLFGVVWDVRPLIIAMLGWFVSLAWRLRRSAKPRPSGLGVGAGDDSEPPVPILTLSVAPLRPLAGMFGLFVVPLIVLLFSYVVQPSWVSKYSIAGAMALAPLIALICSWTRRVALVVVAMCMLMLSFLQMVDYGRIEEQRDRGLVNRNKHWKSRDNKQPFVFVVRGPAYMLAYTQPKIAKSKRILLVDMRGSGVEPPSRYHAYELEMAAKVHRYYPVITMIKPQDLRNTRSFDFAGAPDEFEWLNKAIPLRKTAEGFYKPVTTAPAATEPATTPATTAITAAKKHKKH